MSTEAGVSLYDEATPAPQRLAKLDEDVFRPMESFPTARWAGAITVTGAFALLFVGLASYTAITGIGLWGNNNPVGWGWAIVNFVFWIGIGHAGTLISAILFLLRQRWRTGIARFAEAMTIFAVICALQFPLIHTGRPWLAMFWLIPYPNGQGIYQNFRSPLEWDVFAVSTYGIVSFLFWFTALIPDLVDTVNSFFSAEIRAGEVEPITEKEVRAYYREDAWIWRIYLAFRRIDRSLHRLLGKDYPYILPGKIKR